MTYDVMTYDIITYDITEISESLGKISILTILVKSESRANLDLNNFQINNLGIEIFQKTYQIMSHFENIGRS